MKHANISFFIPQIGCKFKCSFCDQSKISGATELPTRETIEKECKMIIDKGNFNSKDVEIAFFGGSFTAIPQKYRLYLLEIAKEMIKKYNLKGIRCSTRPDAIDNDIIKEFIYYGGTAIELGCQSMDDTVLEQNNRGHSSLNVEKASRLIKHAGIELGHQMMIGLYGDTEKKAYQTAKRLSRLSPDTMRIYPTLVLENTMLANLYNSGEYKPLKLQRAVETTSNLMIFFEKENIKIIRVGLQDEDSMKKAIIAGPYHPAFKELCENKIYFDKIYEKILKNPEKKEYNILCNEKDISKIIGHKKDNINKFKEIGYMINIIKNNKIFVGNFELS